MIFEEFFATLELQHFKFHELLKHTDREGNTEPPRSLWDNIVPTILVLDKSRAHLGVPRGQKHRTLRRSYDNFHDKA